jgi:DNA repair exonuclease SbcCD ATPase subunit
MKILHIRLVNFVGVRAAMGLNEISFDFSKIEKPIIQLYGKNRCGKTVLIQQLHPFSSINLNGDERSDLNLIISGENGIKEISYELNGDVYFITHTYKATSKTHTISSSIKKNGVEMNANGGVNTFNQIIESIFGINKYSFQFVINGTQLTSFANMTSTQRKTLLNKAMGIDIYDKIHKMATDDYRYTNKLIASLSNTLEYLLQNYGSYETLCVRLKEAEEHCQELTNKRDTLKSSIDMVSGRLQALRAQDPKKEYYEISSQLDSYMSAIELLNESISDDLYDRLVQEQISLNQQLSELKTEYSILMNEIDNSYSKQHDLETQRMNQQRTIDDIHNMEIMHDDIKDKLSKIKIIESVSVSSNYFRSMISLAQAINSICNEIVNCLSDQQLKLFYEMIINRIDIAAFLIKEGSVLMDSEKEKSAVSRIQSMIQSIQGDIPDDCRNMNCLYRNTYETLVQYFKTYHSTTKSQFTVYDMEQFDHANKNLNTLKNMLKANEFADDVAKYFDIVNIFENLISGMNGIDVNRLKFLMEEAARIELRDQYIKQLTDIESTLSSMKSVVITIDDSTIDSIKNNISTSISKKDSIKEKMDNLSKKIDENERKRSMLSNIKNLDVNALNRRKHTLLGILNQIELNDNLYNTYTGEFNQVCNELDKAMQEYDKLQQANTQYMKTISDIDIHNSNDAIYKAIAEATSSTKGKPVITIRDTVNRALNMTNQLLHVMYEDEIKMLRPIIDETEFTLPFRCGFNESSDIRYGSQSESTLLSLAISLSLASTMIDQFVPTIDELDAYLDANAKDGFVLMLQEMMIKLNVEQLFVISHSVGADQYPHIVHTVDISRRIQELK